MCKVCSEAMHFKQKERNKVNNCLAKYSLCFKINMIVIKDGLMPW